MLEICVLLPIITFNTWFMTFLSIQFYIKADNNSKETLTEEYFLYLLKFTTSCHKILKILSAILVLAE